MEMAAILGIFGICLMFSESSSALTVDIPQNVYKISRGDTVTIPCRFTPPKTRDNVRVIWAAAPDVSGDPPIRIITYSGPNTMNVQSKYKDRATLIHDIPSGRADLQLQRVNSEDTRVYLCRIKVLNKDEDAVYDKARLVVLESSALTVDIPQNMFKIARGNNVRIPCRFTPPKAGDKVRVKWEAYPDVPGDPAIIILIYSGPTESKVQSKYKGSATLVHDILSGKVYLQLQRVTRADTRVFLCRIKVLNSDEDAVSNKFSLVVLVAPSPPICTIKGEAEYYEDIKLTCRSEEGTPTPVYKWRSYDTNNISRPIPPKATDLNRVLSLYSITKDTSGFFICTSTNEIRSEKCNLSLTVIPPFTNKIEAVVAVAVIFGVILLYYCCCWEKKSGSI